MRRTRSILVALSILTACGIALLLALPVVADDLLPPSPKFAFPSPPAQAEREARNEAEREAGVVLMEDVIEIAGRLKYNVWTGKVKGKTEMRRRARYLVLGEKGAETLAENAFFGDATEGVVDVRGRTLTASGAEYPVDPEKDVRDMDVRDSLGKTQRVVRTVFFPHVERGAVLDLYYSVKSEDVPSLRIIPLQEEFPTRSIEVDVHGALGSSSSIPFFWISFFLGPVPAGAVVRTQEDLSLSVSVRARDVPALPDEPASPPTYRTGYVLALAPKAKRSNKDMKA